MAGLKLAAAGERQVVITRRFSASPQAIYRAHTDETLIPLWLLGPDGWHMPACSCDARPGGQFRYEWADEKGMSFHITGQFIALIPFSRIEHVEQMHMPAAILENHVITSFASEGTGTLVTILMTLPDKQIRDGVLESGMERGLEASFARLEGLI